MPYSAVRTFTDPGAYHAANRAKNRRIEITVQGPGAPGA
jgi:flagellar motor protein MotB